MTDTEKKIAEIREALEKATPGPWVYDDISDDIYADKTDVIVCYTVGPEDGRLIANAPEWLCFLLSELDRLKHEIESHGPEGRNYTNQQVVELRLERERLIEENRKLLEERDEARRKAEEAWKEIDSLEEQLLSAQQEIEQLREERDKLIEGLRWYADEENQKHDESTRQWENVYSPYEMDGGHRARNILKEIGVTVE